MKKRYGLVLFVAGGMLVACIDAFNARFKPGYIDRAEAIALGLSDARDSCLDRPSTSRVDCLHLSLKTIYEEKDGWAMTFESVDERRTWTFWIGRRGEYDSMGWTNADEVKQ